jgi:hypothetical protein
MAAFLSRGVDSVLKRGGRRAALEQFWTTQGPVNLSLTTIGIDPRGVRSDGTDVWVANSFSGTVMRVRAGDGKLLETWTGATVALSVLPAMGRVFVTGSVAPGRLYQIDPRLAAGVVTTVASNLGGNPRGIAFDGGRIWTTGLDAPGSVSIVTPGATTPWTVTSVTTGFSSPRGATFDGSSIWVTDAGKLLKLNSAGAILLTVTLGNDPSNPMFDGSNIWVPIEGDDSISVVRASNGAVLATLTGNGLFGPSTAAFDGQRVLVTNFNDTSVSLWKAADLTPIGNFSTGTNSNPFGACSDGVNFWITLNGINQLARF